MKRKNDHLLSEPLFLLLERVTALNGFLGLLNNQLSNYKKMFRRSYEEQGNELSSIVAGFSILLRDLTVPTNQRYLTYLPGGAFTKKGEQYFEAADEIVENWAAWSVAQSYEAFETFLRDITAEYFFNWPPEKPIGGLNQIPIEYRDISAWRKFFRSKQWNSFSLLELLRITVPKLVAWERENILRLDLQSWHSLFATVRHAIVHSNMKVSRSRFQVSSEVINFLLPREFPGKWQDDEYSLELDKDTAKRVIINTSDYAYLIFKCLCLEKNVDWNLLKFASENNPA